MRLSFSFGLAASTVASSCALPRNPANQTTSSHVPDGIGSEYQSQGLLVALRDFFFSSRRRHTRCNRDWNSDVCSSDLRNVDETSVPIASKPASRSSRVLVPTPRPTSSTRLPVCDHRVKYEM